MSAWPPALLSISSSTSTPTWYGVTILHPTPHMHTIHEPWCMTPPSACILLHLLTLQGPNVDSDHGAAFGIGLSHQNPWLPKCQSEGMGDLPLLLLQEGNVICWCAPTCLFIGSNVLKLLEDLCCLRLKTMKSAEMAVHASCKPSKRTSIIIHSSGILDSP